ncbi:hypothetical protein CSOJ01_05374 [Colletotrichum sojae]|uniref:Uncharacterized protein n=1 Tax=Colletotrichum sojae TaxID=2175907 RepID=A0A8H6JGA1_9PEZI|nr:hypothetical protein CSOJ01_05374 [Colletotrichum sojae]
MADILGVIAAMIQLVEFGDKFATQLRRFSHFSSSRAQQVEQHAIQAQNFSISIGVARFSLMRHCEQYPQSPVLRFMSSRKVCNGLEENYEAVIDRLNDATNRMKKLMRTKLSPVLFFKWFYYKDLILLPFAEMESLKTCLLLLMSSAILESIIVERRELSADSHERIVKLDEKMSVNGYVTSSTGWKVPATAIVLDSMEDNVISMVEADRLGIIVEPQDDGDIVTLLFNDGSHTDSVGRARLIWSGGNETAGLASRNRVEVKCQVIKHCHPSLVFGTSFKDATLTWK